MQTSVQPLTPRDAACADGAGAGLPAAAAAPAAPPSQLPPQDADPPARRRWLATSPWPEVVFAAAL